MPTTRAARRGQTAAAAAAAAAVLLLGAAAAASASGESWYRPSFHFTAESGWINDPYGYVEGDDGLLHVFYQRNAASTHWADMHWGHATTPDFGRWCVSGRSRVSMAPTPGGLDAAGCFDGRVLPASGARPAVAVYTGVVPRKPPMAGGFQFHEAQLLAVSRDPSLREWSKEPEPLLTEEALPRGSGLSAFRDPFLLPGDRGEWLMLVSSGYENGTASYAPGEAPATALLYRTANSSLAGGWTLDSVLLQGDPREVGHIYECANLFPLGGGGGGGGGDGSWLLVAGANDNFAQYYYVGGWSPRRGNATARAPFRPLPGGARRLDHGTLYATSGMRHLGRVVLQGWVPEGEAAASLGLPFAGVLGAPRVAWLDADGATLLQAPHPAVAALRDGEAHAFGARGAASGPAAGEAARHVWVEAVLRPPASLLVLGGANVTVAGGRACVGSVCGPLPRPGLAEVDLVVLADASVVEVFADGGRFALTARVYPAREAEPPRVEPPSAVVSAVARGVRSMWIEC